MKTFVFSAVAMAVLASCTNSAIDDVVNNDEPVAIRLSAGVQANGAKDTRAPITGSATFVPTILAWEGNAEPTDYATSTVKWTTTTDPIAANSTNVGLKLTKDQYYNSEASINTYMKAYYPEGTFSNGEYSFKAGYATNGTQDVLISNTVSGNKSAATNKLFTFTHPLSQFKFEVAAGVGMNADVKVKSIKLKSVKLPTGITVGASSDAVKYGSNADLSVPITGEGVVPTSEGASIGDPVMVCPLETTALTLDVETSEVTYTNIPITIEGGSVEAGTAYTITLTLQNKQIAGNATVTDWKDTGKGSGTVE